MCEILDSNPRSKQNKTKQPQTPKPEYTVSNLESKIQLKGWREGLLLWQSTWVSLPAYTWQLTTITTICKLSFTGPNVFWPLQVHAHSKTWIKSILSCLSRWELKKSTLYLFSMRQCLIVWPWLAWSSGTHHLSYFKTRFYAVQTSLEPTQCGKGLLAFSSKSFPPILNTEFVFLYSRKAASWSSKDSTIIPMPLASSKENYLGLAQTHSQIGTVLVQGVLWLFTSFPLYMP